MRRTAAASIALAAVLVLLAVLSILPEAALQTPVPARREGQGSPTVPIKPVEAYAAIAERPLFQPSRRPAPPPAPKAAQIAAALPPSQPTPLPPPPPPPPVLAPMTLLAVVISSDKREAVLGLATGKSSTLAEGESLDGWILARVLPDRVVFRLADTEKELTFPVGQAAGRPGPSHVLKNPSPPTQRKP